MHDCDQPFHAVNVLGISKDYHLGSSLLSVTAQFFSQLITCLLACKSSVLKYCIQHSYINVTRVLNYLSVDTMIRDANHLSCFK